jgi:hypothetical protein
MGISYALESGSNVHSAFSYDETFTTTISSPDRNETRFKTQFVNGATYIDGTFRVEITNGGENNSILGRTVATNTTLDVYDNTGELIHSKVINMPKFEGAGLNAMASSSMGISANSILERSKNNGSKITKLSHKRVKIRSKKFEVPKNMMKFFKRKKGPKHDKKEASSLTSMEQNIEPGQVEMEYVVNTEINRIEEIDYIVDNQKVSETSYGYTQVGGEIVINKTTNVQTVQGNIVITKVMNRLNMNQLIY